MLRSLTIFAFILLAALWALPVQAEMAAVSDSDLGQITGKQVNESVFLNSTLDMIAGDGNIQVGYYQWADSHTTDSSNHKGANDTSADGSLNSVQMDVVAESNAINWGAYAAGTNLTADVDGAGTTAQVMEGWATFFVGGF